MPEKSHHWRISLWHRVRKYLAIGLLLFGVVVGLITVLLPFTGLYQRPLERFLSSQWSRQVKIAQLEGRWRGTGPEFEISNLSISGENSVTIDRAKLKINIYKYLWPGGSNGLELVVNSAAMELAGKTPATGAEPNPDAQPVSPRILEQLMSSGSLLIENLAFKLSPQWQKKFSHILKRPLQTALQVQQDKNQRAMQLTVSSPELVKQARLMAVTNKRRQVLKDARWYVDLEDFRLAALKDLNPQLQWPASQVDGKFWFTTRHGRLVEGFVLVRLSLDESLQAIPGGHALSGHLRLDFSGDPDGKHWQARLRIQNLKSRDLEQDQVNLLITRENDRLRLQADVLDIAMLHNLLVMFGLPGLPGNQWQITGVLRDVSIVHDLTLRRPVSAAFAFEQIRAKTPFFQADNLAGQVRLQGDELRLLVDSDNGRLAIERLLRRPVEWQHLVMVLSTDLQAENPDVRLPHLWCDCTDFELDSMARVVQGESLHVNLASQLRQVKVRQLYKYWPAGIWKEKLINWLDNALQSGSIPEAGIAYLGDTRRYPFADRSGKFLTQAEARDVVLQYEPDWPKLRNVDATVKFLNRSMQAQVRQAKTMGATITHGQAEIPDFKQGQLKIALAATGRDNYLINFLRASELSRKLPLLQEDIRMRGRSDVDLRLELSLKPGRKKPIRPFGAIHLRNVAFSINDFSLESLRGDIALQGLLLKLDDIAGEFLQNPVVLSGTVQLPEKQLPVVDLLMQGPLTIATLEQKIGHELPLEGTSHWRFKLASAEKPTKEKGRAESAPTNQESATDVHTAGLHFSGESDLVGVKINLPLPLFKRAPSKAPVRFDCDHPCSEQPWQVGYSDVFTARVRWLEKAAQLAIERLQFGQQAPPDVPIGGEIETLDLDGWLAVLARRSGEKSLFKLPEGEYRFHIRRGLFMSRLLTDVDVRVIREADAWRITLHGLEIEGEVLVADDARQRGIVVQLKKLIWPEVTHLAPTFEVPAATGFDLPALHVWVKDFTYQGIPLGEMRLEARPVVSGMKVEKFESRNRWITLNATGDWVRQPADGSADVADGVPLLGESRFHVVMVSDNLGKFLQSIGYDSPIRGGQTVIEMNTVWPGSPAQFSFDRLSGDLTVSIGPGEVTDAKPGIGRVFGLLNLTNLPRRLILDFADVLSQGLRFEAMTGHFTLRNGQAWTDDFEVLYSGARIRVKGSMDLVRQTYDQTLTVVPKVGQILPTLGAIAGGPAGAAAGFFMQGVLHDSLKKSGKFVYHVTGPWDNPNIELIDVDKARPEDLPLDYRQPEAEPAPRPQAVPGKGTTKDATAPATTGPASPSPDKVAEGHKKEETADTAESADTDEKQAPELIP